MVLLLSSLYQERLLGVHVPVQNQADSDQGEVPGFVVQLGESYCEEGRLN